MSFLAFVVAEVKIAPIKQLQPLLEYRDAIGAFNDLSKIQSEIFVSGGQTAEYVLQLGVEVGAAAFALAVCTHRNQLDHVPRHAFFIPAPNSLLHFSSGITAPEATSSESEGEEMNVMTASKLEQDALTEH